MTAPESSPTDGPSTALDARRYRRLFDQDLVGVYRSDPERGGVLVSCNRAVADMFGYDDPEQMQGRSAAEFYHRGAEDREDAMRELRERGELVEYALEMERRDGSPIWVLVHSKLVDDPEDGRVVEGMMVDVTERVRTRRELAERERRFREMAENVEEVFWLRTPEKDDVLYVSPAYERITGRSSEMLYRDPRSWLELVHSDDRERVVEAYRRDDEGEFEQEYRIVREDGQVRWLHDRSFPVRDDDGQVHRVAGITRDVTERRNAQEALAEAKQKYEALFDVNPVSLVVIDAEAGVLLEANRGFEELFGYARDEVEGRPLADLDIFLDSSKIAAVRGCALAEGEVEEKVLQVRRSDGEVREVLLSSARVDIRGRRYLVSSAQDVSPLKERERHLRRRATHDALTDLPNRELLRDRCEQALRRADRRGRPFVVGYLDLDDFKAVNDRYGHAAGDRALVEVARRLGERIRDEDTLSRVGGDEFVLVLEEIADADGAARTAGRLLGAFDAPFEVAATGGRIGASLGLVLVTPETARSLTGARIAEAVEGTLDRADEEMYRAKRSDGERWRLAVLSADRAAAGARPAG